MAKKKKLASTITQQQLKKVLIKALNSSDEKRALTILKKHRTLATQFAKKYTGPLGKDVGNLHASALMIALENELSDLAKFLLTVGAKPNVKDDVGRTPLMIAACRANYPLVVLLLKKGAKVNTLDQGGLSALIYAVGCEPEQEKVIPVAKVLLEAGAKPNLEKHSALFYAQTTWGKKPLQDKARIIALLKKYGAKVGKKPYIKLNKLFLP